MENEGCDALVSDMLLEIMRRIVITLLIASASACSLLTSLDDLTHDAYEADAGAGAMAEARDGASDERQLTVDSGADDLLDGGALEDGSLDGNVFDSGCMRRPVSASNATPDGSDGTTCSVNNILELDGVVAGFDTSKSSPQFASLVDEPVKACVRVQFDGDIGRHIIVHATPIAAGCLPTCGYDDAYCLADSAPVMKVFEGASEDSLQHVDTIMVKFVPDAGVKAYNITRPPQPGVRLVIVCQAPQTTADRADLGVDYVEADCP